MPELGAYGTVGALGRKPWRYPAERVLPKLVLAGKDEFHESLTFPRRNVSATAHLGRPSSPGATAKRSGTCVATRKAQRTGLAGRPKRSIGTQRVSNPARQG